MVESRHHFWYAFTFTLVLSIIRFTYAHYPLVQPGRSSAARFAAVLRRAG